MTEFVLLTCEHGGNRVPTQFKRLFRGRRDLLSSHRGYDPGALELARVCARRLRAPLRFATVTRLVVELNRSLGHPALFSSVMKDLTARERDALLLRHYFPYRQQVEADVEAAAQRGRRVVHLSIHTFTPVLDGETRRADVGLLYDPRRAGEVAFCARLKTAILERRTDLSVRKNYPYRGAADGFTTSLRKKWSAAEYVGIEVEVNQRWPFGDALAWRRLKRDLASALAECFDASR